MKCEYPKDQAQIKPEREILRTALALNAVMFIIGMTAGLWAQSIGLIADALDMLADAFAYTLALLAITHGATFKRMAARWSGLLLLVLGAGIVMDVVRRSLLGSEPHGLAMITFSLASLVVNLCVLRMLYKFRHEELHLKITWIFTRTDVVVNLGVFVAGLIVWLTGAQIADILIGLTIGLYVIKEALEILREAQPE